MANRREEEGLRDWFTSDLHLGHSNIIRYCNRPFECSEEMDTALIDNINRAVEPKDRLHILGDFSLTPQHVIAAYRERIQCEHIVLVKGNHDRGRDGFYRFLFGAVDDLRTFRGAIRGKKIRIVLCHYAMRVWRNSHHGYWHLYGHSHGTLPEDPRSMSCDIGVDSWMMKPVSLAEVADYLETKRYEPIDHHGRSFDADVCGVPEEGQPAVKH